MSNLLSSSSFKPRPPTPAVAPRPPPLTAVTASMRSGRTDDDNDPRQMLEEDNAARSIGSWDEFSLLYDEHECFFQHQQQQLQGKKEDAMDNRSSKKRSRSEREEVVEVEESNGGDVEEVTQLCHNGIVLLNRSPRGRPSEAATFFLRALSHVEAISLPDDPAVRITGKPSIVMNHNHPTTATTTTQQQQPKERADPASYIYQREHYDEGMYVFGEALSLSTTATHGASKYEQQLILRYNLGQSFLRLHRYHTARRWFQTAWQVWTTMMTIATPAATGTTTRAGPVTRVDTWDYQIAVRLQHNLGFCSYCLGQNDVAMQWYQGALRIIDTALGCARQTSRMPPDAAYQQQQQLDRAATCNCVAVLLFHRSSAKSTDTEEAWSLLQSALFTYRSFQQQQQQQHMSSSSQCYARSIATCLGNLGRLYFLTSDHDAALQAFREAHHLRQQLLGDHAMDTAVVLFNYGQCLHHSGALEPALEAYREFLRVARRHFSSNNNAREHCSDDDGGPSSSTSLSSSSSSSSSSSPHQRDICAVLRAMAQVQRQRVGLLRTEQTGAATAAADGSSSSSSSCRNDGSKQQPASSSSTLSDSLMAEASTLLQEAFEVGCGALGKFAKEVSCILSELGSLYAERHDYERSMECFRQFLDIQKNHLYGSPEPFQANNIMITKINLARVCKHAGDYATALQYYQDVYAMQMQESKPTSIAGTGTKDATESETCAEQSHSRLEIASTLSNMGLMLYLTKSFQPALECYQEALRIRLTKLGTHHHPDVAENINSVGLVLYRLGLMDMAKEAFQECLRLRTQLSREKMTVNSNCTPTTTVARTTKGSSSMPCAVAESKEIAVLLFNMATACMQNGEGDQGIKWYNESLRVERKVLGHHHPDVGVTLKHIARVHEDRGEFQSAIKFLNEALEVATSTGNTTREANTIEKENHKSNETRANILRTIGNLHYMLAEVPQMIACFAKAERMFGTDGIGMTTLCETKFLNTSAETLYGLSKLHPPAPAVA